MKKTFFTLLFFCCVVFTHGQKKRTHFVLWTFQQKNVNIYGLAVGLWDFSNTAKNTTTNGIRLSVIGEGILLPLAPESPIASNDSLFKVYMKDTVTERINGISLTGSGNAGTYIINGISLGVIGHFAQKVNGISAVAMLNLAQIHNGIQIGFIHTECYHMNGVQFAFFNNYCYHMNGIQIGFYNTSKHTRGIQLGLWNVNEKRKFPLFNWNFR